jgi:hypothetical protein
VALCVLGDFLLMSISSLCPILKARYGEFYLTEAKHFLEQGGFESVVHDENTFRQLIQLNEDIRVLLFKALVQIELAYNALLIELMDNHYKKNPYWYAELSYEGINLSSQKKMPAFELIGQQSFGTVVFFHHKAPENVKKMMAKRLEFPKHHKAYQVATLFGTLVYLRNDVSHNRWLIRKTFKAPIPSFTKEEDSNRTALSDYFQWIEHLLSLLSLEASHAFFLRLNELKMTAPRAIQEGYF